MVEKVIHSFDINENGLLAAGERRRLTIIADVEAKFSVQVVCSDGTFYNFDDQTFSGGVGGSATTFGTNNTLNVTMAGTTFSKAIYFPASTTNTYSVILTPDLTNNTVYKRLGQVGIRSLSAVADTTVTLAVGTKNTADYSTAPASANVTSTGSAAATSSGTVVTCSYTMVDASTDANGFGLRPSVPAKVNIDAHWYFETTETVDGTTSSSTSVVVDSTTDLAIGMELTYTTGTTPPASATTITAIDTITKTLTLSTALSLTDGNTMTFRAYGLKLINKTLGCEIQPVKTDGLALNTAGNVEKTIRGAVSASTTITVDGTYGIAGGSVLEFTGPGVDNSSTNNVNVVTASSTLGSFTCDVAQTLKDGQSIYFDTNQISTNLSLQLDLVILKYPSANRTIYLDLDKFITPGVSGA